MQKRVAKIVAPGGIRPCRTHNLRAALIFALGETCDRGVPDTLLSSGFSLVTFVLFEEFCPLRYARFMTEIPTVAPPDPNPRTPKNQIPKGACDCHFHVFDGPSRQISERSYSAPAAALDDYRIVQTALGLDRSVIVQPSI